MSFVESVDARMAFHIRHKQARERMGCGERVRPSVPKRVSHVQERRGPRDVIYVSTIPARIRLGSRIYDAPIGPTLISEKLTRERHITCAEIQKAVCAHFNLPKISMTTARKSHDIVIPRQIAMYLCAEHTKLSTVQIGVFFGGRDHSTSIHNIKKIRNNIEKYLSDIDSIRYLMGINGRDGNDA